MKEKFDPKNIQVIDLSSMSFLELMKQLEERPYYFSERTIQCLEAFLNGWFVGKGSAEDNELMSGFNKYVEAQFGVKTTHGWAQTILYYSQDSYDALEHFFKLFNTYIKSNV